MAIITFCSNEIKETGQTLSLAAIASYMSIEHNYKILIVSTNFNDLSLENCFWEYGKIRNAGTINKNVNNIGLESGIEGLIQALNSNKTNNEIVKNYSKIILNERLDMLLSPITKIYQEYSEITKYYLNILQMANRYYDLVFVDLNKKMPTKDKAEILQLSDLVIVNLTQRLQTINNFIKLKEANEFYRRKNVVLSIGRYDALSKYNNKNVTRYLKEKDLISVVPYNTLYFEACSEGTIIDFMLKVRNIKDENDKNYIFGQSLKELNENIIFRLKELQMRI